MSKQTAVDWLFQELWDRPKDKMVWYYILEKAKQMEREQIEDSYDFGVDEGYCCRMHGDNPNCYAGQEYYVETYKEK